MSDESPDHALSCYGWDREVAGRAASLLQEGLEVGRVVRVSRGVDYVRLAGGEVACERSAAAHRRAGLAGPPAVGDWAGVRHDDDGPVLVALVPRHSQLTRRDPGQRDKAQIVAANVDVVLLVFGLDRPLRAGRLERGLVMAHAGGAAPAVVLTKADVAKHRERTLAVLQTLAGDLPIIETSSATGIGLDDLATLIASHGTAALVGESGSGKSSLVNALLGWDAQGIGDVRARDRKGRHTTTRRELFPLPRGGTLIDTPGLRALGLWLDDDAIEQAFPDIDLLLPDCRFRDCRHRNEPGCAVQIAVHEGRLEAARLARYLALDSEAGAIERRREARAWQQGEGARPLPPAPNGRGNRGGGGQGRR